MKAFVFCLFLAAVAAEAPFSGYAPSGWRPSGAQFRLPNEYGAPLVQQPRVQVEVTKERVAHAAQIAQIVETTTELNNEYLPPTTTDLPEQLDPIRVQGLPDNQVKDFQRANPVQAPARRVIPAPQQQPLFPISGQLRALASNGFQQFGRQQVEQPQQLPAQTYGTPDQDQDSEEQPEEIPQPTTVQPDSDDSDDQTDEEDEDVPQTNDGRTVVAVANAFSGQYYILGSDNTLQRVTYATSQDDEDQRNMGFSAQLRYSKIDPITGPVYAYNEQGQLVRIYK